MSKKPFRVVVLISGNGSNLQAIIEQQQNLDLPIEICTVLSNKHDAYGLERARKANITTVFIDHTKYADRESFDAAMQLEIDKCSPDLVVLAGFMRILSESFVKHYLGKMINIHPSLLPDYPGLNTHQRVLDDSKDSHGVSVHYVTPELDGGPVFLQSTVTVEKNDTTETLAKKVQVEEHYIYPLAIKWIVEGRINYNHGNILFDDKLLKTPIIKSSHSL